MKRSFLTLVLFILLSTGMNASDRTPSEIRGSLSGNPSVKRTTYFIKRGDRLSLIPERGKGESSHRPFVWYSIEPLLREYDNSRFINSLHSQRVEPIRYIIKKTGVTGPAFRVADFIPVSAYGTYYFACEREGERGKTVREEYRESLPLHIRYRYTIIQVVYREDDSYIGYLKELFRTPFAWGPRRVKGYHQAEERSASDCASFVLYGKRRMGYRCGYTGPAGLVRYLDEIGGGFLYPEKNEGGRYRSRDRRFLPCGPKGVRRGDILHFQDHVAVFYEDAGVPGFLDKKDRIIHSIGVTPHISTIEKSRYFHLPLRVYRWR